SRRPDKRSAIRQHNKYVQTDQRRMAANTSSGLQHARAVGPVSVAPPGNTTVLLIFDQQRFQQVEIVQ
ncbi:hypothetical protein, partial [Citrobacter farmeri]|uniref:hypothetical protein n=1 Tax=Citrobacter farmeri TaxID=67824 RepID=UPI002A806E9F